VIKIVDALPNTIVGRHVGGQLLSAATSSGANYEEGCGAESRPDFMHETSVVLKELKESRFWLRIIIRTQMLSPKQINPWIEECGELCAIIGKSVSTARKGRRNDQCSIASVQ
jgi:four helix bundle protein